MKIEPSVTPMSAKIPRRVFLAGAGASIASLSLLGHPEPAHAATWETIINNSLQSYSALEAAWNYRYPWGSDHNGSARMYASATDHNYVSLSGGVLTIAATRLGTAESPSSHEPYLPIRYRSGAIHGKPKITISDQFPEWEVKGDFQAPTSGGTWPAFWLTAVQGWPPESDILEFKGTNVNWFNTFRTPTNVSTKLVTVATAGSWHNYRAWITKVNSTDADIHYYLDGVWQAVHRANGFVGKPMNLIINLQMEGASGSSGPGGTTFYRARNVYVGRTRAF